MFNGFEIQRKIRTETDVIFSARCLNSFHILRTAKNSNCKTHMESGEKMVERLDWSWRHKSTPKSRDFDTVWLPSRLLTTFKWLVRHCWAFKVALTLRATKAVAAAAAAAAALNKDKILCDCQRRSGSNERKQKVNNGRLLNTCSQRCPFWLRGEELKSRLMMLDYNSIQ